MTRGSEILEQAENLFRAKMLDDAIALIGAEVERNPDDLLLSVRLAEFLRKKGEQEKAVHLYRRCALAYADQGALPFAVALYKVLAPLSQNVKSEDDNARTLLRELVQRYQSAPKKGSQGEDTGSALAAPDIPLFEDLSKEELEEVIAGIVPIKMKAGMVVFKEGDKGSSLFVVTRGYVRVSCAKDETRIDLARLGPGDFFGEWSLVSREYRRHAWVETETEVEMLELSQEALEEITGRHPRVAELLEEFFRRRRLDTLIATVFPSLSAPERRRMAECLGDEVRYTRGTIIYREGDTCKYMTLIRQGTIEVFTNNLDGARVTLALLGPGQYFGEGGALSNTPRTASVRARTDVAVYNISREDLVTSLVSHPELLNSLQGVRAERLGATLEKLSEGDSMV